MCCLRMWDGIFNQSSPVFPLFNNNCLFPTCQVRVSRFYQSYFLLPPPSSFLLPSSRQRTPDLSGHCRTSTANSRSQWALPDLNRELLILSGHCRTLIAGSRSQWALPDFNRELQILSGHCRTLIASSRSTWALPDLNHKLQISVGTAGPQPRAPDSRWARQLPDLNRELQILSGHCRTSTASSRFSVGTAGP